MHLKIELTLEQEFLLKQAQNSIGELPRAELERMFLDLLSQDMMKNNVVKQLMCEQITQSTPADQPHG